VVAEGALDPAGTFRLAKHDETYIADALKKQGPSSIFP
jgi:cytochrome c-type biogenesis protein CcmE